MINHWMRSALPALVLGLVACGERVQPVEPDLPEIPPAESAGGVSEMDPLPAAEPELVLPVLDAAERGDRLGFARYLPADTEMLLSVYDGVGMAGRVQSLKLWSLLAGERGFFGFGGAGEEEDFGFEPEMEMELEIELGEAVDPFEGGFEPGEAVEGEDGVVMPLQDEVDADSGPGLLLGREVTVAVGRMGGEQAAHALLLNQRSSYFQMRAMVRALAAEVRDGESDRLDAWEEVFGNLLTDQESGMGLFEKMEMPPLWVAFRAPEDQLDVAAQQVAGVLALVEMASEAIVPLELERAGAVFLGYKIVGENIAKSIDSMREEFEEEIDPETLDRLLIALAKKDLVIVTGTIGDYVLLFVGRNEEEFQLAATAGESLAGTEALAFTDAYAGSELAALVYGERDAMRAMVRQGGGLAEIAKGIRDGLAGSEGLGDTRDIEALLQIVTEREAALLRLATTEAVGVVAYFEDGLKIESHGGTDSGALDWEKPLSMSHLGAGEGVVLFANMSPDAAYDRVARAYFDSLVETAYAMTLKLAELPLEDTMLADFHEAFGVFNEGFREDALALWESLSGDLSDGLAPERALVMDLAGSMPAFPGVPQAVVDEARFPRISVVAPVTDRSKLAASWEKMNASSSRILGKISEMAGRDIPMQRPLSSERNGLTSWFFALPFSDDDFNASVTVGDEWFAASSSRLQALDLIAKAAEGGEARRGLVIRADFAALQVYAQEMLGVIEANADAIFGDSPGGKVEFEEEKERINKIIAAFGDFDSLSIHSRREDGALRTSVHFKTR
jgi:hypothetical protein